MDGNSLLAQTFEAKRRHLLAVAYRMLGSAAEADDAVQEAWLRASRSGAEGIDNLVGWVTTIVGRVCLDMLRSRQTRREEPLAAHIPEPATSPEQGTDPEDEAVLADSVGLALLVVLDRLEPAERLAFVLHDMFALPFDEIAVIVGKSAVATRQLASRARRRVQGSGATPDADLQHKRRVVEAFLAASRAGEFVALVALLDPDVVLRADGAAVRTGAQREVCGAGAVAETFSGRARAAQLALVDGEVGAVWAHAGQPRVVFEFTIVDGQIIAIDLAADPEWLAELSWTPLD
jgi:RNA polymerase sigma-70 factor (ECF subfamily)